MTKFYLATRFVGGSGIEYYSPVVQDGRLTDPVKIAADLAKKNQQRQEESHTLPLAAELVEWAVLSDDGDLVRSETGLGCVALLESWLNAMLCEHGQSGLELYGFRLGTSLRLAWMHAVKQLSQPPFVIGESLLVPSALAAVCTDAEMPHVYVRDPYGLASVASAGVSLAGLLQYCGENVSEISVATWDVVEEVKTVKFLADKLGL